jgi:hypothetical protein
MICHVYSSHVGCAQGVLHPLDTKPLYHRGCIYIILSQFFLLPQLIHRTSTEVCLILLPRSFSITYVPH